MSVANPVQALLGRLPEPGLEATLAAIRLGLVPAAEAIRLLTGWPLLVLDTPDPSTVEPLLLRGDTGAVVVAAFTSPDRIGSHADAARRPRWLPGGIIARGAQPGVGVAINTGTEPSLLVGPDIVDQLRGLPAQIVQKTPGSRALTALELAIVRANAGAGDAHDVAAEIADADLHVHSSTDPASAAPRLAVNTSTPSPSVLAWTDRTLFHGDPERVWAITVKGRDLYQLTGGPVAITLNPGTGLQFLLAAGGERLA
jgi:hypothetical protein